jgi:hypothetical protein
MISAAVIPLAACSAPHYDAMQSTTNEREGCDMEKTAQTTQSEGCFDISPLYGDALNSRRN